MSENKSTPILIWEEIDSWEETALKLQKQIKRFREENEALQNELDDLKDRIRKGIIVQAVEKQTKHMLHFDCIVGHPIADYNAILLFDLFKDYKDDDQ